MTRQTPTSRRPGTPARSQARPQIKSRTRSKTQSMSPEEWARLQQIRRQYQARKTVDVVVPPSEAIAFLLGLLRAGRIDPPARARPDRNLVRRNQIALPLA